MLRIERGRILVRETSVGRLYVYFDEWESHVYLHIRYFYYDKKDEIWTPSRKGIAIPEDCVKEVFNAIVQNLKYLAERRQG